MRTLFETDIKNYAPGGSVFSRPSARGIIVKAGRAAMVYSRKYDYYQFPGGGMTAGESREDALIREVLEETGLSVIRNSIREYGHVRLIQKGRKEDIFIQDNFYFLCDVKEDKALQNLDEYEADEGFTLRFPDPWSAIAVNRRNITDAFHQAISEREAQVLELLIQEGYLDSSEIPSDIKQ